MDRSLSSSYSRRFPSINTSSQNFNWFQIVLRSFPIRPDSGLGDPDAVFNKLPPWYRNPALRFVEIRSCLLFSIFSKSLNVSFKEALEVDPSPSSANENSAKTSSLNIGELMSLWLLDADDPIDLLPIDSMVPSSSGLSSDVNGNCNMGHQRLFESAERPRCSESMPIRQNNQLLVFEPVDT
ncbi:hypothetical protein AGLY_015379 [Aphis glycines]|uniref:Uncharacterized protein n=1 Tax=Aphis glycines TaxID=307491 RepID=A0A6G0T117_APHGL|nr:hypothetical protein AGLY_015379 [Aphis glycines]